MHWCISKALYIVNIYHRYVSSGEHKIHQMWTLLPIYNTGQYHGRVQYLNNSFVIFDCLHHLWFSRNQSGLRWLIFTRKHRERVANYITWLHHIQLGCHRVTSFLQSLPCLWSFDAHIQSKETSHMM